MSQLRPVLLLTLIMVAVVSCSSEESNRSGTFTVYGSPTAEDSSRLDGRFQVTMGGSPTSLRSRMYAAWVSPNQDCSDPVLLEDHGSAGQEFDLFDNPTLFTGSPPDGTYPCLIVHQDDTVYFRVDSEAVATNEGCEDTTTEYWFDSLRTDTGTEMTCRDLDGNLLTTTGTRTTAGVDQVYFYITTAVDEATQNCEIPLDGEMIVPGQTTFYWDGDGKIANLVVDTENICSLERPLNGFR